MLIGQNPEDVTPEEAYLVRWAAFLDERFPVLPHLLLAAAFFTGSLAVGHAVAGLSGELTFGLDWVFGALVIFLGMYHYRYFDEHKDYEEDLEYNPGRVIQRDVFTLDELKVTAIAAMVLEAALSFAIGLPAFVAWVIGFVTSLLLLVEFFISDWFDDHFVVYGFTLLVGWIPMAFLGYSVATGEYPWAAPGTFWLYALGVYAVVANWEVSRKMRVPDQDPRRADAYTVDLGVGGAAWVVAAARLTAAGAAGLLAWMNGLGWGIYAALGVLLVGSGAELTAYLKEPTPERAVGLRENGEAYMVGFHLIVAGAFALSAGVTL